MASSDTTVSQHHKEKMAHNYPEGAKHHSPGQGPASAARRTVALGSMRRRHISREIRAATHRDLAEAEIIPRRDCVLDNAPVMGDAFHSDEDTCDGLIQGGANLRCASVGSALGYDVNVPLGRFHRLRRLRGPLESLTKRIMNNHPVRHLLVALCLVVLVSSVSSSAEQKWGSLKGRFVYTEGAITPEKLNVNKDAEYCTKHNLLDEQIMTGEKGELQNVFVYLNTKKGKTVPVHPALEAVNTKPAVLDNKGCSFQPHAMVIRINQPLEIKNTDSIGHNTNFQTMPHLNPPFNQIIPSSASITKSFEKQESYPSSVVCNIHPWMKAYVLIRDIPYMAVSGKDGSFVIKNIPAGEHEFIFWHEAPGVLRKLKVGDAETSRKGRAKLKIPADETLDLGDIKVTPKVLGK